MMKYSSFEDSGSVFGNSSLSSFLTSLTEDKEVTDFEIVADNARMNQDSFKDLSFSAEPAETSKKCRWRNLVREDSDNDLLGRHHRSRSKPKRRGSRTPSTFSDMPTRRVSSDPNLLLIRMPRRTVSPDRSASKIDPRFEGVAAGRKAFAASDTNLLRMPTRKPSPVKESRQGLTSHSKNNASWGTTTANGISKDKKNMFLDMMMAPDLTQVEYEDKPVASQSAGWDGDAVPALARCGADEMSSAGSLSSLSLSSQPKMVMSKARLIGHSVDDGRQQTSASNKLKSKMAESGLHSRAKLYGLY